jgi:hypothetical protein
VRDTDLKAPWTVEFNENGGYDAMGAGYEVYDAEGDDVVTVETYWWLEHGASDAARHAENPDAARIANLIAAAPEMLVALEELLALVNQICAHGDIQGPGSDELNVKLNRVPSDAYAALAKARGER